MKTRKPINLLSKELQNQIAAGEVVERPASVVKELVENALDAGASQVDIVLENGGQGCIYVQDNGHGIAAEELQLAVTRHATSKIQDLNDLTAIYSYGFRGEALPSIASVSRFAITSSVVEGDGIAERLEVEYGHVRQSAKTPLKRGTIVEVYDLFSNIPARLKFLKTPSTESKKAQEWLTRLALARAEVGFSFSIGNKESKRTLFRFPVGQSLYERLSEIWPPLIMDAMRPFDLKHNDLRAFGLAALPHVSQPRADRMLFYVNGRAVSDKTLTAAVRDAYKGRLTTKDYPQVVLFLEIDGEEVDVNVHPAKTEVRFQDSSAVFSCVRRAVNTVLESIQGTNNTDDADDTPHRPQGFWGRIDATGVMDGQLVNALPAEAVVMNFLADTQESGAAQDSNGVAIQPHIISDNYALNTYNNQGLQQGLQQEPARFGHDLESNTTREIYGSERVQQDITSEDDVFGVNNASPVPLTTIMPVTATMSTQQEQAATAALSTKSIQGWHYLGQVAKTYLVLRDVHDDLLLLDQHAAHERILYARMQTSEIERQNLVIPIEIALHSSEIEQAQAILPALHNMGFTVEMTQDIMHIQAIPALLALGPATTFVREALAGRKEDYTAMLISYACKNAIKAGQALTNDEALGLLEQWLAVPERDFCPHGRPAVLRFSGGDLEKLFKRVH